MKRGLIIAVLGFLLMGCNPFVAVLEVSDTSLQLSSANETGTFVIANRGEEESVLNWSIASSSPLVTTIPSSGQLLRGDEDDVVVNVDKSGLVKGQLLQADLTVRSSGGEATVRVVFEMQEGGLLDCGTFAKSGFPVSPSGLAPASRPDLPYAPGELLVQYKRPFAAQSVMAESTLQTLGLAVAAEYDLRVTKAASLERPALVRLADHANVLETARRLEADPRVAYAEPNYYLEPLAVPNDRYIDGQWNLLEFGLPQAWDIETGTSRVVIAIIDAGVDTSHEDLAAKILPGCDFHDDDNNPAPSGGGSEAGHGTHVAGIAGAVGNNAVGVAGVGYGAGVKLLPVKVFDDAGVTGTVDSLLDAMLWAAGISVNGVAPNPNPADIINMSLGVDSTGLPSRTLASIDATAERVFERGVVMFAATGNSFKSDRVFSPANSPLIYAVGSVDGDRRRSDFSNYDGSGAFVDFMAPGGSNFGVGCGLIRSTFPEDGYACLEGTSMASPFVAGVAALLLSQDAGLSPADIRAKLRGSALFDTGFMTEEEYGAGIVCADRALGAETRCGR